MAEILIAPQRANAPTPVSGGDESRVDDLGTRDGKSGTSIPFASILKSRSEKNTTDNGKNVSPPPEVPASQTIESSATNTPAYTNESSALLSLLVVNAPRTFDPSGRAQSLSAAKTPPAPESADSPDIRAVPQALTVDSTRPDVAVSIEAPTVEPPIATGVAALPVNPHLAPPLISPLSTTEATGNKAGVVTESVVAPAVAVPLAATVFSRDTQNSPKITVQQHSTSSARAVRERGAATDKLAADAAITAETSQARAGIKIVAPGETDFHATVDRMNTASVTTVGQTPGSHAPTAAMPALKLETPLGQPGWREDLGQKLTWMVGNNRQQAELILNPPQLGRIEVTLTLDGDKATASFISPHAAVREVLENSIARLREVLGDAGVTLGQTHVGADSRETSFAMNPRNEGTRSGRGDQDGYASATGSPVPDPARSLASGQGMVDVFV